MQAEAAFFKVLADPTRLRLAVLLSIEGETCVCSLAEALQTPQYTISRHLGIMRSAGMVEARRQGEDIIDQLKGTKAWPISMSYFEKTKDNSGEKLPIFESSFLLYENGISSDLLLRYPEYTLSAKLSELELFEKPACKSKG